MALSNENSRSEVIILQLSNQKIDFFSLSLFQIDFKSNSTMVFQPNGKNVLTTKE